MIFLASALAALLVMLAAFAVSLRTGVHAGVDIAWGLGFTAVAVACVAVTGHGWLIAALTAIWGVRLAIHIARRYTGEEDPRYAQMLAGRSTWHALRTVYLTQAVALWFVSLPVQVAALHGKVTWWSAVGSGLWAIGLVFEAVGDAQLARFRNDPASRGKVLDTGLWRYTRHPNYFGDACVWWGLFALACVHWTGWLTILSPLVMTYFLAGKTGKPLMEKHLSSTRPGYADYVARTSAFIPRPPRPQGFPRP
ncbi:DUF1295 domain-containing protein [Winogradskya consettensis]|uniref:Membrane protein n=1 Tax=Winogradskya consettensis TaxID=113560 RepID=A0A919SRI3_9ACTN|nr:DUF1295 domain-containing protein [Actinoplanes consettensis]GIM75743.1 membrane protein [Actinoplanes consettensis]